MNSRIESSIIPRKDIWDRELNDGDWFHTSSLGIWHIYKTPTNALCGLNIKLSDLEKKVLNANFGRNCKKCMSKLQMVQQQ